VQQTHGKHTWQRPPPAHALACAPSHSPVPQPHHRRSRRHHVSPQADGAHAQPGEVPQGVPGWAHGPGLRPGLRAQGACAAAEARPARGRRLSSTRGLQPSEEERHGAVRGAADAGDCTPVRPVQPHMCPSMPPPCCSHNSWPFLRSRCACMHARATVPSVHAPILAPQVPELAYMSLHWRLMPATSCLHCALSLHLTLCPLTPPPTGAGAGAHGQAVQELRARAPD
jgi:hypothetical protein